MRKIWTSFIAGALGLSACMQSDHFLPSDIVTREVASSDVYKDWNGDWTGRQSSYRFIVNIVEMDGKTAVCGIRATKGDPSTTINQKLMSDLILKVGGQEILRNLSYFPKARSYDNILAQRANCRISEISWSKNFEDTNTWTLSQKGDGRYRD